MNQEILGKLSHVSQQVDSQLAFFRSKRNENRSRVLGFGVASVSLSAVATVAIGAKEILGLNWLPIVALVATSLATVVGVWENVFAYRQLWNLNNQALAELGRLRRRIDYRLAGGTELHSSEVDQFFEDLERVLTEIDGAWIKTYSPRSG